MLQVKAFFRPDFECLDDFGPGAIRIVGREPDYVHTCAQVCGDEKVTLLEGRRQQARDPTRDLGEFAKQ